MSTLTSWRWAFTEGGPVKIFLLIFIAVLLAIPLSSTKLPERYPVASLFSAALFSSFPFLNSQEILLDSARYFLQAKYLTEYGFSAFLQEWGGEINQWTDLPLIPMIYGILFKIFGEHKLVIEIFNSLLFSLVPVLVYFTGKHLWDNSTGFIAGILILASPYLYTQVSLMLVDIHTMFFLLLAVCTFLYATEKGGFFWIFVSAITFVMAMLSKYSTWPMLSVLGLVTLIKLGSLPGTLLKRVTAIITLTVCLISVIYLWKGEIITGQIQFLRTYQMGGLKRWHEGYISAFIFQVHPLLLPAALFGIFRALKNLEKKMLIMGWLAALVFFLELKRVRYILPFLPFYALTGAYGLQVIKDIQVRRYIAYGCVASSLVIAIFAYKPFLHGTSMANLKDAGKFLNTLTADAVEVYCLPQNNSLGNTAVAVPILDLFTNKTLFQDQQWVSEEGLKRAQNISLRFTWELSSPRYYRDIKYSALQLPLVVISSKPVTDVVPALAEKYPEARLHKMFTKTSGIYRFQTFVSVFEPF